MKSLILAAMLGVACGGMPGPMGPEGATGPACPQVTGLYAVTLTDATATPCGESSASNASWTFTGNQITFADGSNPVAFTQDGCAVTAFPSGAPSSCTVAGATSATLTFAPGDTSFSGQLRTIAGCPYSNCTSGLTYSLSGTKL